ncbi:hypothetical protein AbraIFM66950_008839 [Aspergillus brasiliensis]|nr:hypothetical protein AbraIFM66950_008839 [Aspergillus brasiliensis]
MYNGLRKTAKDKILTGKKLIDTTTTADGVTATCTDGSTYKGSIITGADGVYSKTRQIMRDIALHEDPTQPWEDPEHPFTATYQLLYGSFPSASPAGQGYDIQAQGKAIMLPAATSARTNYTQKDVDTVAAEFADFPLTHTVKVKDVWLQMLGTGLTNLDEGIVKQWSLGRIVLVGDACDKMTTHLGLGFNHGIQDVVVLCNRLRQAVRARDPQSSDADRDI